MWELTDITLIMNLEHDLYRYFGAGDNVISGHVSINKTLCSYSFSEILVVNEGRSTDGTTD